MKTTLKWWGDSSGYVDVSGSNAAQLKAPEDVAQLLDSVAELSPSELRQLGRYCYFMCVREARMAHGGDVLHAADKYLDALYVPRFPSETQDGIEEFKESLWQVRSEEGYALVEQAFQILGGQ